MPRLVSRGCTCQAYLELKSESQSLVAVDGNSAITRIFVRDGNQIEFAQTAQSSVENLFVFGNANIQNGTFKFVNIGVGAAMILGGRFGELSANNDATVVIKGGTFLTRGHLRNVSAGC